MSESDRAAEGVARLGRRPFLKSLLWGGAAVAAVAGGSFAWLRRSKVDDEPVPGWVSHLHANEYHLMRRLIPVLLPVAGTDLTPPEEVPVLRNIDAMIGQLRPTVRQDVAKALVLIDNAAVVSGWHGQRLVDLDPESARAYFDAWTRGNRIQRAVQGVVKQFVYTAYWREPATWPPVEFDGPVTEEWGLEYFGNAPLPEADQEKSA
jgi:hypothetical protein